MTEPIDQATKLLPCPFCGIEPEWINESLPDSHYYIRCPHCHIVMKEDRRDKVIGMWSRRSGATVWAEKLKQERSKAIDECIDAVLDKSTEAERFTKFSYQEVKTILQGLKDKES